MGRTPKWACCWPGLPQLWLRGSWSGLGLAVGFSVLLNLVLVGTLVWTEWLGVGLLQAGWFAVVGVWGVSAWLSWQGHGLNGAWPAVTHPTEATTATVDGTSDATGRATGREPAVDLFQEVYGQYLQGNWFEAESLLMQLISRNPRDAEALLMLATLRRHTGRLDDAEGGLERLTRLDEAARWLPEIERERALIAEARADLDGTEGDGESEAEGESK